MSNDTTSPLADRNFRTSAAVKCLRDAEAIASGSKILLDRSFASELQLVIGDMMSYYHPNPNGSDWRCEFCNSEEKSEWNAALRRYDSLGVTHRDDCFGRKAINVLDGILEKDD